MDDLTSFSFRIPKALAARITATARQMGLSKSEYARRAMEELDARFMEERIAELSQRLATHSSDAAQSMEAATGDGLP